jgi:hypothetical protein
MFASKLRDKFSEESIKPQASSASRKIINFETAYKGKSYT